MSYVQRPGFGDRPEDSRRRSAWGRFWIAVTLIVMDLALVAVAGSAWSSVAQGTVSGNKVAAIGLLGACAAFGVIVVGVVAITNLAVLRADRTRGSRAGAHRLASAGVWLALVQLVGLMAATVVVAATAGASALGESTDWCTLALAGADAVLSLILAWSTAHHIGPGSRAR